MRRILIFALLAAAIALAGCAKDAVQEAPPADTSGQTTSQEGLETGGVEEGAETRGGPDEAAKALLAQRVIYFDFDSYEIQPQYRELITAHARNLAGATAIKVRLEGHTDERGSREYNIGLGERRAQAVRRALMLQGGGDGQIVTVSYGEERPAQAGGEESAWSRNRRVEFVYAN